MSNEKKNVELSDTELESVVGGGSYIADSNSTDYWRCLKWLHYCDNYDDNECKCDDFSINDPICLCCSHAAASKK